MAGGEGLVHIVCVVVSVSHLGHTGRVSLSIISDLNHIVGHISRFLGRCEKVVEVLLSDENVGQVYLIYCFDNLRMNSLTIHLIIYLFIFLISWLSLILKRT